MVYHAVVVREIGEGDGGRERESIREDRKVLGDALAPEGTEPRVEVGDGLTGDALGKPAEQPLARASWPWDVDGFPRARTDHHVRGLELFQQGGDLVGRISAVGVHDHAGVVLRCGDPRFDGGTVAAVFLMTKDARAGTESLLGRPIIGAIIHDENLVHRRALVERSADSVYLARHRALLVEGGQDHGHREKCGTRLGLVHEGCCSPFSLGNVFVRAAADVPLARQT